jgi:hypothetical protein
VVDSDPLLESVALSWTAMLGDQPTSVPAAPVFGTEGGNAQYVVTTQTPDDVDIRYTAQVNFLPPKWPVIETNGRNLVRDGGNQILIKPSAWVGRHMIYMYIRDGDRISFTGNEGDHLVCNVSYSGAHLPNPILASARISPLEPLEFSYPLSPDGARGEAKFSAFGVIGGRMVRATEQTINFDEEAVFILAGPDGVQLVSESSVLAESDTLAQELLRGKGRPIVDSPTSAGGPTVESGAPGNGEVVPVNGDLGPMLGVPLSIAMDDGRIQELQAGQVRLRFQDGYLSRVEVA